MEKSFLAYLDEEAKKINIKDYVTLFICGEASELETCTTAAAKRYAEDACKEFIFDGIVSVKEREEELRENIPPLVYATLEHASIPELK